MIAIQFLKENKTEDYSVKRKFDVILWLKFFAGKLPEIYEEFSNEFSFENLDDSIPCVLQLLEETSKKCVDWLFRIYAPYYTSSVMGEKEAFEDEYEGDNAINPIFRSC